MSRKPCHTIPYRAMSSPNHSTPSVATPGHAIPRSLAHSLLRIFHRLGRLNLSRTHSPNPHRSHSLHASQTSSCTRRTILHVSAAIVWLYPLAPNKSRPPFSPLSPLIIPRYILHRTQLGPMSSATPNKGTQRVSTLAPLTTLTGHLLRPRRQTSRVAFATQINEGCGQKGSRVVKLRASPFPISGLHTLQLVVSCCLARAVPGQNPDACRLIR